MHPLPETLSIMSVGSHGFVAFSLLSVFARVPVHEVGQTTYCIRSQDHVYSVGFVTRGNNSHATDMAANDIKAIGCSTTVPNFCANNPVMNGTRAPPDEPIESAVAHGYTGPRNNPTMDSATAFPMMLGTSHTKSWKTAAPMMRSMTDSFSPILWAKSLR
ncbi:hypothetical protein KCU88_g27, partial [Aureobasidium melanogenum]